MKPDTRPVSRAAKDRGEAVALMEPLLIGEGARHRSELTDLALELAQRSAGFHRSLPSTLVGSLSDLVRSMNCYYSNLIEGHDTHPIDIEAALSGDLSADRRKRDLQLEAKAHIEVQRWLDGGPLSRSAVTVDAVREIHRRFCEHLPVDLLWVPDAKADDRVEIVPGAWRDRDVAVGRHVAIGPAAVPRFMERFQQVYGGLGKTETIIAAAAAHHRLVWIHPFLDGNGRVARLVSHATLLGTLDTGAVWSIARGLARSVDAYKGHLAACDQPRRNDLDGRGNLSEEALVAFTRFFLQTCLDQVAFMESLMQPEQLRARILLWAAEKTRAGDLPSKSEAVLEALLYRGDLPRGEVSAVVGTGDRQARRVVSALVDAGAIASQSSRANLRLAFPATLASRWMPGLFPERRA